LSIAVLVPVVWMVSVVETAAVPVGVTLAGLKLQLTPVGSPLPQLKRRCLWQLLHRGHCE
jgi:hypothetical protein